MVSSDGFSIDTTAPVPDPSVFFYMDTANGEARPVTKLMASNSTIQVIYGCNDNESSIVVSICCPVDFCLSASVSVFLSFCLLLTVPKQWRLIGSTTGQNSCTHWVVNSSCYLPDLIVPLGSLSGRWQQADSFVSPVTCLSVSLTLCLLLSLSYTLVSGWMLMPVSSVCLSFVYLPLLLPVCLFPLLVFLCFSLCLSISPSPCLSLTLTPM